MEEIENIGAVERSEGVVVKQQIETLLISEDAESHEEEDTTVEAVEPEVRTWEQEAERPDDDTEQAGPSQQCQELPAEGEIKEQEPELQPEEKDTPSTASTSEQPATQIVEETAEDEKVKVEEEDDDDDADARGTKRKMEDREEGESTEQGTEKKKKDDEAMASMLADFVDCPPDDEDHGASQSQT